jgi:uncharacterized protein involved in outer membrane biogenesis
MKIVSRIIIVFIILLVVLVAGRNIITKIAVEKGVESAMGLPLKIKKIDLGLAKTHVGIEGLKIFNPEGFPKEAMFHASEIFVDYNLGAIIKGKIHLEDVRLNFDEFVIVKNKEGKTNLEALKPKAKEGQTSKGPAKKDDSGAKKSPQIQIDHLSIKIGKVVYKDYSQGGDPVIKEYVVNISEEINDVTDPNSLMGFIASKALAKTALASLGDFDISNIKVPEEASGLLKNTAETLKEKMKLPF